MVDAEAGWRQTDRVGTHGSPGQRGIWPGLPQARL